MPQSLAKILIHAVFSTKNRQPMLADAALRGEIHAYLGGISNRLGCPAICVGVIEDHVHILVQLSRTIAISDWTKEVKRVSSAFAKSHNPEFAWQAGYGAFSVDPANQKRVATYIERQQEHHRSTTFQDEFRKLLREHSIEWDERYVWD